MVAITKHNLWFIASFNGGKKWKRKGEDKQKVFYFFCFFFLLITNIFLVTPIVAITPRLILHFQWTLNSRGIHTIFFFVSKAQLSLCSMRHPVIVFNNGRRFSWCLLKFMIIILLLMETVNRLGMKKMPISKYVLKFELIWYVFFRIHTFEFKFEIFT